MDVIYLDDANVTPAQVEEITRLLSKSFVEFNSSVNAHPDVIFEEFGDPNMDNNIMIITGYFKGHHCFAIKDESGTIVGVTFVDVKAKGSRVAVLGPVASCKPGAGRKAFEAACAHAEELGFTTLILEQVASNVRSFALYNKCGFVMIGSYSIDRYPKSNALLLLGPALEGLRAKHACFFVGGFLPEDYQEANTGSLSFSQLEQEDVAECAELFVTAHGKDCGWDRRPAIEEILAWNTPFPRVVARGPNGKIVGYTTGFFLPGHHIAESEDVLRAIIAEASRLHREKGLPCPKFQIPMEYPSMVSWALGAGLSLLRMNTLMAKGTYEHEWPGNGFVMLPNCDGW